MKYSSVVCFAGGDWWYHHPHSYNHLMRQFAKEVKVLYVNSLPVGGVGGGKSSRRVLNKLKSAFRFFKRVDDKLFIFTPFFIPMKDSKFLLEVNSILLNIQIGLLTFILNMRDPLFWITNPNGYIYLRKAGRRKTVYQVVDKVPAYRHAGKMTFEFDRKLSEEADLIFTPGRVLFEEKSTLFPSKSFRIRHGVDVGHFSARSDSRPADFPSNGKKTFTYWGSIDYKKVDYDLLKFLSEKNTEYNILLIGRIFDFRVEDFLSCKSIFFIGEKSYEELKCYASFSDGFLIPWDSRDEMNRNASPIKLREYLSTGKPIVATYIPEFEEFKDLIYISKDKEDFLNNLKKASSENSPAMQNKRIDSVKENSWRKIYEEIDSRITGFNNRR